jgi:hypothetical protein
MSSKKSDFKSLPSHALGVLMPEVDLGYGKSKTITVRLSDEEARDFYRAAETAYNYRAIPAVDVEELMVLATKVFVRDMNVAAQRAAAAYQQQKAEQRSRAGPTHYMKNAIEQVENISDELDSWGGNSGRP